LKSVHYSSGKVWRDEMAKGPRRTPRGYDDVKPTGKNLSDLISDWFGRASERFQQRPDLVLLAWGEVVGERLSPMAQAVSFIDGVLTVNVKNSSLYSLFVQHEKMKLLDRLQKRVPSAKVRNIIFRLG
jgi:hypothetical protein